MKRDIVFGRTGFQRYRSILHLIDPLVESGFDLFIEVGEKTFDLKNKMNTPCDSGAGSKDGLKYLLDNFGIPCSHFEEVNFILTKNQQQGLRLTMDTKGKGDGLMAIPYVEFMVHTKGSSELVGNPMCDLVRNACEIHECQKDTVMIIHPGGGRGFISPMRSYLDKKQVINNNINMMKLILDQLPDNIRSVTIKTHPMPYLNCDKKSLMEYVVPSLKKMFPFDITVADTGLDRLIAKHEFIINMGSSACVWLMGSEKKWINLVQMARFAYKLHRDRKERTERWFDWPQHVTIDKLTELMMDYDNLTIAKDPELIKLIEYYRNVFKMDSVNGIVEAIKKEANE